MAKRSEKGSLLLLVASAAVTVVLLATQVKPAVAGDYTAAMETAVRDVVKSNKGVAPGLVRLLFHDGFVRGCDASVLLLSTPTNVAGQTEQASPRNVGLRGLDVIQKIRDAIFVSTRVNVSCADAIVFAAREATFVLSGDHHKIEYDVDGPGRPDGIISSADDPERFLPATTFTFKQLLDSFKAKGFGVKELVSLIGTHGIGVTHKKAFEDRLELAVSLPPRSEIDGRYQAYIKTEATLNPNGAFTNNLRDMGVAAQISCGYQANGVDAPVGTLDNSIYNAILQNRNRFQSDWVLRTDPDGEAQKLLLEYKTNIESWKADFRAAMTRLSNELVSEGTKFEVGFRKDCTRTNLNSYP